MHNKTSKALKKGSTPIRHNPTSQASNMISSPISPSVAAVGGTDSPVVNNNKQSQLGGAPSPTRAMQQLCSHMDQLKRAAAPCSDFKRFADNPWLKLLTQVHEDQMFVIKEQSALIVNLQGSLLGLQGEAATLLKNNQDLSAKVDLLEKELSLLKNTVTNFKPAETARKQEEMLQKFENHLNNIQQQHSVTQDESDQHKLLDSVVISSPDFPQETDGEDCAAIVIQELQEKIRYSIQKSDIKSAYRVGFKSSGTNNRKIRVKLDSCSRKSDLVSSAVSNKSTVYVNECLTRLRQNLFLKLRGFRKNSPAIKHCFVRDGKIIARKSDTGKTYVITTEAHLNSFLNDCGITAD